LAPRLLLAAFLAVASGVALLAQQPPAPPPFDITRITGDLYRGNAGGLHNIFLVTPDGIILADPITTPYATWLKAELAARFRVPVKYVIYSHKGWAGYEQRRALNIEAAYNNLRLYR
jgi:hypothetical protein